MREGIIRTEEEIKQDIQEILNQKQDIEMEENLIEAGLGSLQIMRLVNKWRKLGSAVTFAKLMKTPTLQAWMEQINVQRKKKRKTEKEAEETKIIDRYEPFEMTDVQYSYWVGRRENQVMGGNGCHAYLEVNGKNIEVQRLNEAFKKLVAHHPMLHTRFTVDGKQQLMQKYEEQDIVVYDLSSYSEQEREAELLRIRGALSHRKFDIAAGKTVGLALSILGENKYRIHYDVDLLVADVQSFQRILQDLAVLYMGGELSSYSAEFDFAQYLKLEQKAGENRESEKFWIEKLEDMPERPKIPVRAGVNQVFCPKFTTRTAIVKSESWEKIKEITKKYQVTSAMFLLTVYAVILERWSEESRFVINLPIFNRDTQEEGIEDVISDFSNLLLLDFDFTTEKTFCESLVEVQNNFHNSMMHADYSGVKVVRELSKKYHTENVAPIVFACNLGKELLSEEVKTNFGKLGYMISQTPQVWLDFQMFDYEDGALLLKWDAVEEIFPENLLDSMFQAYVSYVEKLAAEENLWEENPIVDEAEKIAYHASYDFKRECTMSPKSLLDDFLANTKRNPGRTAVIDITNGAEISYGELKNAAMKIAGALIEQGIHHNERIAVTLPKGSAQIEAVLGALMAGGCYVPIGVQQPLQRQQKIHETAKIQYVIADRENGKRLQKLPNIKVLILEDMIRECSSQTTMEQIAGDDLAYIIFTSGSTGCPKGVEIQHAAAYNTIRDINERYQVGEQDRVLAISALDFDLSVYDIFGSLSAGGSIVTIGEADRRNSEKWLEIIQKYQVTIWNSVPAIFEMLLISAENRNANCKYLRRVLLSGDWIGLSIPYRMKKYMPQAELTSLGGATEASIWSNYYDVACPMNSEWNSIPYGHALTNQQFRIVDHKGRNCPEWVPGELLIGGKGLAKCYCNNELQTSQHFFVDENGERWYRTGDLGKYHQNGVIEFLGRKDFQVKVRGHRIEIGEIEAAFDKISYLNKSLVTARRDEKGENHLVAFLVPKTGEEKSYLQEKIRKQLAEMLVPYMIPNQYVFLDEMPMTSNGKIDRKKLEQMEITREMLTVTEVEAPQTEIEKEVAKIWQEVLGVTNIGRQDNYFDIGGDSLSAVKLSGKIRDRFDISFSLEDMFEHITLCEQAKIVECNCRDGRKNTDKIQQIVHDEQARYAAFPLTEIQRAYWFGRQELYQSGNISTHYYFEVKQKQIDMERLERAINDIIENQDMLHAVIAPDGASQRVMREVPYFILPHYDCSQCTELEKKQQIQVLRQEMAHRQFEADKLPLFDIRVIKVTEEEYRINFCFDNIIFDGFSIFLFFQEVSKAYRMENYHGLRPEITFRDYMLGFEELRKTSVYEESRTYWLSRMDNIALGPELPFIQKKKQGGTFQHLEYRIEKERWHQLKNRLAEFGGITPSGFLIGTYVEILNRWSRNSHFTINLTHFNRIPMHEKIHQVMGDFTALTLLETDFSKEKSFLRRCQNLQQQLWKDLDHPYYDGVELQRELTKKYNLSGPVLPVVFTSAIGLDAMMEAKNMFKDRIYSSSETPQVWLDHQVSEEDGVLVLVWDYVQEMFPELMIEEMFHTYKNMLENLIDQDEIWRDETISIAGYEYPEEVERANQTAREYPPVTLKELYQNAIIKYPDNLAVTDGVSRLTYRELEQKVSPICGELQAQFGKEQRLAGIMIEKSVNQILAVLAVSSAGAGYVPIDVKYPTERVEGILKEAQINIVVTDRISYEKYHLDGVKAKFILLEDCVNERKDVTDPGETDLAYIIYTSGSTGKPKGVAIEHRAVTNTILDVNQRFHMTCSDRSIAVSNLNFDLSVYDIFGMVACGGGIVVVREENSKNPYNWRKLIQQEKVTVWNTVPSFAEMLIEGMEPWQESRIRVMMMSGDWIPLQLPDRLRHVFEGIKVISLGGATEASIWSNYYEIEEVNPEWKSIPYGKPLSNQRFYILDNQMQRCPVNVPGTLYIAGRGLAREYYQNESATRERFVEWKGERIYNTGDLGKYLEDGTIEFLGREDFQVKINGFRIELEEIDEVLKQNQGVRDAYTVVNRHQNLVSFLLPEMQENRAVTQIPDLNCVTEEYLKKEKRTAQQIEHYDMRLEKESLKILMNILQELGVFKAFEQGKNIEEMINDIHLESGYQLLMRHWMKVLKEKKILQERGKFIYLNQKELEQILVNREEEENPISELQTIYREHMALILEVLRGRKSALELFFTDDAILTPMKMSKYNFTAECQYQKVAEILHQLRQQKNGRIQVGEIGTRSGYLTEYLHKNENMEEVEYSYLEESQYFREYKRTQNRNAQITWRSVDLNEDLYLQGVNFHKYDLLIADNTLHRFHNLPVVLKHMKSLLNKDGLLVVIEQNENSLFLLNTAGLMEEGFSRLEDFRKEKGLPLLTDGEWRKLLEHLDYEQQGESKVESEWDKVMHTGFYVVKNRNMPVELKENHIRQQASQILADYMLPATYIMMDAVPVTSNGKIDRKQLKRYANAQQNIGHKEVELPKTEEEKMVYQEVCNVLGASQISMGESFIEAGGDSLTAIRLNNFLKDKYRVEISLKDIFQTKSLRELAGQISRAGEKNFLLEEMECGEL